MSWDIISKIYFFFKYLTAFCQLFALYTGKLKVSGKITCAITIICVFVTSATKHGWFTAGWSVEIFFSFGESCPHLVSFSILRVPSKYTTAKGFL